MKFLNLQWSHVPNNIRKWDTNSQGSITHNFLLLPLSLYSLPSKLSSPNKHSNNISYNVVAHTPEMIWKLPDRLPFQRDTDTHVIHQHSLDLPPNNIHIRPSIGEWDDYTGEHASSLGEQVHMPNTKTIVATRRATREERQWVELRNTMSRINSKLHKLINPLGRVHFTKDL